MANLPVLADQSDLPERLADQLVAQMAKGVHPRELARRVYPKRADRFKKLRLYHRLKHEALNNPHVAQGVADEAKLAMMVGLTPTIENLLRQARRRPDAAKLILEASGFHNPRVKHDHSGKIEVALKIPRPRFDADVPDADVVE